MSEARVPQRFARVVDDLCRDRRYVRPSSPPGPGEVTSSVRIDAGVASKLAVEAARRAVGLPRDSRRRKVLWTDADGQLAVGVAGIAIRSQPGTVVVTIPVSCDQTEDVSVSVIFAVGEPDRPAGMFAATERFPRGPAAIIDAWGDALVAFAWQILLALSTDLAAAVGVDSCGERLVPAQLTATTEGLEVLPMGRHRLAGRKRLDDLSPERERR